MKTSFTILCAWFLVNSILGTPFALADSDGVQISKEESPHPWQLGLNTDYEIMSRAGISLNGFAVGFGASWAFTRRWAFVGDMSLGLSPSSGLVSYFTQFDIGASYALTGSDLLRSEETLRVNGAAAVVSRSLSQGGIRVQAFLTQYLLNSDTASYPFSGFGIAGYYEFPSTSSYSFRVGARVETISNGQVTLMPARITLGLRLNP